jgi:hypothetical protein
MDVRFISEYELIILARDKDEDADETYFHRIILLEFVMTSSTTVTIQHKFSTRSSLRSDTLIDGFFLNKIYFEMNGYGINLPIIAANQSISE